MQHITLHPQRQWPKMIVLCGHPGAGKTTAQEILKNAIGYEPIDDGYPVRAFAVEHLGLSWHDVATQEGKKGWVEFDGRRMQVRDLLGTLGNKFEDLLGPNAMPMMAMIRHGQTIENNGALVSFGSVRRRQAAFYRDRGALVLGIRNPHAAPSPYEFDRFDESLVDLWVENDGLANGHPPREARQILKDRLIDAVSEAVAMHLWPGANAA